jgi:hypothetical protein
MQTGQLHLSLYDTPEKAEFMARALSDATRLTPAEDLRMSAVLAIVFGGHEASFMLRQRGLIEDYASKAADQVTSRYLHSPYVRRWVSRLIAGRDAQFDALLKSMIAEIDAKRAAKAKDAELTS